MNYLQPTSKEDHYNNAVNWYEQQIINDPENKSNYWYLGLALLLQGQVEEANTTWFMGMADGSPDQVIQWQDELFNLLETEAEKYYNSKQLADELHIRQQIQELYPNNIDNLLRIVVISDNLDIYTELMVEDYGLISILSTQELNDNQLRLLIDVLHTILSKYFVLPSTIKLVEIASKKINLSEDRSKLIEVLQIAIHDIALQKVQSYAALPLAEIAISLDVNNFNTLLLLIHIYVSTGKSEECITTAKHFYSLATSISSKIYAQKYILRGLTLSARLWDETLKALADLEDLILKLDVGELANISREDALVAVNAGFSFSSFRDDLKMNRRLNNHLAEFFYLKIKDYASSYISSFATGHLNRYPKVSVPRPLKIGYLSHTFLSHSVGWLARWLFVHHDPEKFKVYAYSLCCNPEHDPMHIWYMQNVPNMWKSNNSYGMAEQIFKDEIDILIDLDSITMDLSLEILALKPAPIQVTWLGWDASGLPSIDYYIADNYVLPENAQDYYTEKIWRLPETYIAVDGFEVGIPSIRRQDLDISTDAIIYLSIQTGSKQQPDIVKLQMEIVKAVPNSYFLIKESRDADGIKFFYRNIAQEVGLDFDRLRFLPRTATEMNHRANLGIADVVLDTYPYNGATTTLETLWMGIPIVTRVGEQFAARNSYTMMMNAGITEGIAWSDEEYIEWGIRLGKDKALRQDIACRLKASRQTAPLWNGKKFTRQMEDAYQQMWQIYLEKETTT